MWSTPTQLHVVQVAKTTPSRFPFMEKSYIDLIWSDLILHEGWRGGCDDGGGDERRENHGHGDLFLWMTGCGACGAGVSILTGDGKASYNFVDEESIAGSAGWSSGRDSFVFYRAGHRSWESSWPLKLVIWAKIKVCRSFMTTIWWMRKFIFSMFDIVAGSNSKPDMVADAPDKSDTKLIRIG
jgi:hypothetical protein